MKRFIATTTIVTLMLASFAGCSKKEKEKENNTNGTPTVSTQENSSENKSDLSGNYITLGGYFTRENVNLSIFISDTGWYVNGVLFPKEDSAAVILSAPLTYDQGTSLIYSENGEQLTFTFTEAAMTVTADKGQTYAGFAGEYKRSGNNTVAQSDSVSPASGSTLELLGRVALTHYVTKNEGASSLTVDIASDSFDNEYLINYIVTYADLFLADKALPVPDISSEYLCYGFSKEELDNVLQVATAGTYDTSKLSLTNSEIVLKDDVYYVPCRGNYAGGLATRYTNADPEEISEQLILECAIVKKGGTRYELTMTLATSENTKIGTAGIQIDSVSYESAK